MDELLALLRAGATMAGLEVIRVMKPEDFELRVKCGIMRTKLAGLADSIGNTTQDRTKKGDWQNVAWNLDPNKGNGGRKVSRSFGGY